ncbi:MAG TPA: hypothetical protein VFR81_13765 [Longimicrobium sp.]|nr:hypothetical protein [Longimicrobium sp.]
MSDAGETFDCRMCGKGVEGKPDHLGLCAECRAEVVRRSTTWAVVPALVVAALYFWMLTATGMFESRFLMVWVALGAALAWVAFKVARRVLFDVVRSRGVRAGSSH